MSEKYYYVQFDVLVGEYGHAVRELVCVPESHEEIEIIVDNILKNMYGCDSPYKMYEDDEGYYYWGGQIYSQVGQLKEISKFHFNTLKEYLYVHRPD